MTIKHSYQVVKRIITEIYVDIKSGDYKKTGHMFSSLFYHLLLGYPYNISIEPANFCNLRCPMCTTPPWLLERDRNKTISFEDYKKIIDDVKKKVHYIFLFLVGEPFLNKDLPKLIAYATKNNMHCTVSTNFNILNKKTARDIVKSKLDKLIISLDGATKETYEKIRVGGEFDRVVNNIKTIVEEKKRQKSFKPIIETQFIVTKINEHEINLFKKLSESLGVDKYSIKTLCIPEYLYEKELARNMKKKMLPIRGPSRFKKGKIKRARLCSAPRRTIITATGDVAICCYDFNARYKIGNAFKQPFTEIWKSYNYRKIRKMMKKRELEICKNCQDTSELFYKI